MKDGGFIYETENGDQTVCQPTGRKIEICLVSNGQRIDLNWELIDHIAFNRIIKPEPAPQPYHSTPRETAPPDEKTSISNTVNDGVKREAKHRRRQRR
jgi:hypothetical protein